MKKSEFEKLKIGDTVHLRTFEELKQLKCYDEAHSGIFDDSGEFRDLLISCHRELLGSYVEIIGVGDNEVTIDLGYCVTEVVRQHLKGVSQ